MICGFVRALLGRFSGGSARSVTVHASSTVQASRTDRIWNTGFFIRSWRGNHVEELISLNPNSAERGKMRVSNPEEKACQPGTRLSRIASPRRALTGCGRRIPMNNKKAVRKIGASFILTLALVGFTYVVLPSGDSARAASRVSPAVSTPKAMTAAARIDQKRARMALGQLPLSFEMNRGQFPPEVQFASRGGGNKAFFTQNEAVFILKKPGST